MKKLITILMAIFFLIPLLAYATTPAINSMTSLPMGTKYSTPAPTLIALPAPTWVDAVVLAANVAYTYTIPTGARYLLFNGNGIFYVNYTAPATVPSDTVTSGATGEIGPVFRSVVGLSTISIIAPVATIVTIAVYK